MRHAEARTRLAVQLVVLALGGLASACQGGMEGSQLQTSGSPLVGAFTPRSKIGAQLGAGGADEPTPQAVIDGYLAHPAGDRCAGPPAPMGMPKAGTLTLEFNTVALGKMWGPANVGAVWIEDSSQNYVKTLEIWAGVRKNDLLKWGVRACVKTEPDVITSATLPMPSMHRLVWNTKDLRGNVVPDGTYRIFIEVSETEADIGQTSTYDIPKGPMPFPLEPPDMSPVRGLKIMYTPAPQ